MHPKMQGLLRILSLAPAAALWRLKKTAWLLTPRSMKAVC
jgi:hypothetical protein